MIRTVLVMLSVLVWGPAWAQVGSTNVPRELPKGIKAWEEFPSCNRLPPCELQLTNAVLEYDLYVDPVRPLLYSVWHYRVRPTRTAGLFAPERTPYPGREAVYWFRFVAAAQRPDIRIFVREPRRPWWTLGLIRRHRWKELVPGSARWLREQGIALRVLSVHSLLTNPTYGKTPATLEF